MLTNDVSKKSVKTIKTSCTCGCGCGCKPESVEKAGMNGTVKGTSKTAAVSNSSASSN